MNSASLTAVGTTFVRAAFSSHVSGRGLNAGDSYAERFLGWPLRWVARLLRRSPMLLRCAEWMVRRAVPGLVLYLPCRSAWIDERVSRAVAAGVDQVVILGAGYDSRAWRFPGARFFEIDHPLTQERKVARAHRRNLLAGHLSPTFVALDFEVQDCGAQLLAAGFDPRARTLFVWEGVTMFLPEEAVRTTLRSIRSVSGPGSKLLVDVLYPGGRRGRAGCGACATVGEPCRTALEPEQAAVLLAECGWRLGELADTHALAAYLDGSPFSPSRAREMSYLIQAGVC